MMMQSLHCNRLGMINLFKKSEGIRSNRQQHPILLYNATVISLLLFLFLKASTSHAQSQKLPNFTSVSGTELKNTNGQWVTFNPTQPNNIDLVESRIFKMPATGQGIVAVEFKLEGADGGTARYLSGANDRFAKGGGGGQVQFTLPLLNTTNYDRPFLVTFGKKGESKITDQGYYCSAGGGGSTGMAWLVPNASAFSLNTNSSLIAAAGGGSGGYSWSLSAVQDLGNNIDADPMFTTSPVLGISSPSPSRDAGLNSHNTLPNDVYGNPRIEQGTIDMGAVEVNPIVYVAADAAAGGDGER
jgi:hypothetical protein